jgi:hypothetical protein
MGGRRGEKIWLPAKRMTELPENKLLYLPNYNAHYSFPPKPTEKLTAMYASMLVTSLAIMYH